MLAINSGLCESLLDIEIKKDDLTGLINKGGYGQTR